jgi:hypothetical protein
LKQCGRFLTGHIAVEGKVAAVEKAAADEKKQPSKAAKAAGGRR